MSNAKRVMKKRDLPLTARTPDQWAKEALSDAVSLLNDHAHLEKKAAGNALDLLQRWPEDVEQSVRDEWIKVMTAVARDEIQHLSRVVKILERRGGHFTKTHRSTYAGNLRALVRLGRGRDELVDRLLVSALIEARSCERFEILSRTTDGDDELNRLYRSLWASEHGHYRVFLNLAKAVGKRTEVARRWHEMCDAESQIIAKEPPGARIHSWPLLV